MRGCRSCFEPHRSTGTGELASSLASQSEDGRAFSRPAAGTLDATNTRNDVHPILYQGTMRDMPAGGATLRQRALSVGRGTRLLVVNALIAAIVAVWVLAAIGMSAVLVGEYASTGAHDLACSEDPSDNSGPWAPSTWSWWPPGKVCHFSDGTTREPTSRRSVVVVVLVLTGAASALVLSVRAWRRRDEAWWPYTGGPHP
jgi:hypothetical protein